MERKNRPGMSPLSATLLVLFSLACFYVSASASTFISGDVFGDQVSIGRNLLQAKKACPVNFEFLNYTIITSKCKGPRYPADMCCAALAEFACPYADELNDLSNDCASTMFSYINLYGKYPPGLFANECKGDKKGLPCPASSPAESPNADGIHFISPASSPAESQNADGSHFMSPSSSPAESLNADGSHFMSPASSPAESPNAGGSHFIRSPPPLLVLTTGLLLLLLQLF
ncbi:GPI-anchored protein LLG1 isoform X6 [Diospyros lotus]|uniref:GPI-anchored protein LLG1 isoform X6 n=1 Tax=Diospyros lotus TaxID=55363 RepID=UPI0022529943|nr:GPI-anchored protein LLG1 isoform X6 [Diospyros lotus]